MKTLSRKLAVLGVTALTSTSFGAVLNSWGTGNSPIASYATMPVYPYPGQRSIPGSYITDTWQSFCWTNGDNKFTLAFDVTSINAPVTSATRAFAKLELDGQTYTSGLGMPALTGIHKPSNGDNTFSGSFQPVNGGTDIFWAFTPDVTWTDFTVQGFLDALSSSGTIYASPTVDQEQLFSSRGSSAVLSGMPSDVPSPASSLVLGGLAGLASLRRRRPAAIEALSN